MSGDRDRAEKIEKTESPVGGGNRSRLKLLAFALVIAVLSVRVSEVLNWAWDARGVGYEFVDSVTDGNDDLMAVILTGLIAGWLILFLLDRTKRFQKLFVVLAAGIAVGWNVFVENHWETVAWGDLWYFTVLAFVGGIASGVLPQFRQGKRQGEYPVAATGLFLIAATLTIIGFLDIYLFATDSVTAAATSTLFLVPPTPGAVLLDAVIVVAFLGTLGNFVLYNDVKSVVFLNSSEEATIATLVGLFHHVDEEYRGRGPNCLKEGYGDLQTGRAPPADICGGRSMEFAYLPPGRFPRWVIVSADPVSIDDLNDNEIKKAATLANRGWFSRTGSVIVNSLVPGYIQRRLRSDARHIAAQVASADVLVYVATDSNKTARFEEVCNRIPEHTDKVVLAAGNITETELGALPLGYTIIEVDWPGGSRPLVTGIKAFRKHLDR